MVKPTALAAGLILLVGACAMTRLITRDPVYHGSLVNNAVEQREDRWWQAAHTEVLKTSLRNLNFTGQPRIISRGNPNEKLVALTFDDGPHPGKAEELLRILRKLDVKATFFVIGKMVERYPELVRMEAAEGHEIGNHSFSHVNLSKIPEDEVETEYRACQDILRPLIGYNPRFCRPPGGQATPIVMRAASKCGMTTAMWSDDPKDYANPGPDVIVERLMDHVSNGGIILLHEGVDESMEILPHLVTRLRQEGFRFVTMSELAASVKPERFEHKSNSVARLAGFGGVARR